ncbi:hypothetical protein BD311DRAFT_794726 [Dichomitus squalens]|uniref:Uncharacterized protein n=1 Tax=Dichomitus squalens TaxID=114155 RepID=A0A4Q9MYJ2_9APHY|nr:hypothetical protein BD311DRAFT_794726 [Dichomitus squalens]
MVRLRGSSGISHLRALLHLDCDKRKRTHSKLAEFFMIPAPLAAYVDASPLNGVRVTIEAKAKFRVWTSLSALEKLGHASASNCDQTPSHAEEARGPGMREVRRRIAAHRIHVQTFPASSSGPRTAGNVWKRSDEGGEEDEGWPPEQNCSEDVPQSEDARRPRQRSAIGDNVTPSASSWQV